MSNLAQQLPNGIPAEQLETWSHQGAVTNSSFTKDLIYNALNSDDLPWSLCDIHLQGSYANSTNTRGNSDVDIMVKFKGSYFSDAQRLPDYQQKWFQKETEPAFLSYAEFHSTTVKALRAKFGERAVVVGNKAIKIRGEGNRLPADVVPCFPFRNFSSWISSSANEYVEGIRFLTQHDNPSRAITNFPEQHRSNCTLKNSDLHTFGRYKPTVRIFKNARTYLVEKGKLERGVAPSYFIECLLYNIPNACFVSDVQGRYFNIIHYLSNNEIGGFVCQNGITPLFGDSPEQWNRTDALQLISAWIDLWLDWD